MTFTAATAWLTASLRYLRSRRWWFLAPHVLLAAVFHARPLVCVGLLHIPGLFLRLCALADNEPVSMVPLSSSKKAHRREIDTLATSTRRTEQFSRCTFFSFAVGRSEIGRDGFARHPEVAAASVTLLLRRAMHSIWFTWQRRRRWTPDLLFAIIRKIFIVQRRSEAIAFPTRCTKYEPEEPRTVHSFSSYSLTPSRSPGRSWFSKYLGNVLDLFFDNISDRDWLEEPTNAMNANTFRCTKPSFINSERQRKRNCRESPSLCGAANG